MRFLTTGVLLLCLCITAYNSHAQRGTIQNDVFRNTQDGQPVYSQGGGIFRFTNPATGKARYYWYGVHYKEAEQYRHDPSVTYARNTFESVTCYGSDDLVNWTFEKDVITKEEMNRNSRPTWVGRLGVAYISSINQYALFVQHGGKVGILTASSPTGNFTWHQEISMESIIGTSNTGDQTVFTDEDNGKSYLIYSYGKGRNKIYISEIGVKEGKVNILNCNQVFQGASREGNCMFKYKGKYYMCASNIYGWDASHVYYLVADDIKGPYTPTNNMQVMPGCEDDFGHVTQTGFFYTIKGTRQETVLYCGDRWSNFAGNGLGYNQWFPLSFNGATPYFNSLSAWQLDATTGLWTVNADNNYIKNGSFEADRNAIPSNFKPIQEQLTGWATIVIKGTAVKVGDSSSPRLNHFNTADERKQVIGEKSLHISDNVPFQRKVFQTVSSSPYVPLPDGLYTLTARIKNSEGFTQLEMYAESNGTKQQHRITQQNTFWQTIQLKNVSIKGGKAEVGFLATGTENAFCYVDDVSLVKQ
ncbi:hypothetical protein HNQ91_002636 [Filimonas zeae]|nr:family 43 glycosylhydrolase [Filimonas zeae]MDR6339585.1 hypothetical protein [Filimonas zeae]